MRSQERNLTSLISKKDVKVTLDLFINHPEEIKKPKLLIGKEEPYNHTLLGFATEILFELLLDNNKKNIITPVKKYEWSLLKSLESMKDYHDGNLEEYYVYDPHPVPLNGVAFNLTNERSYRGNKGILFRELIRDYYSALSQLSNPNCFTVDIDRSLSSILILANIRPLMMRSCTFNPHYKKIDHKTLSNLKTIYNSFPKRLINKSKRITPNHPVNVNGFCGRIDFIIDDCIVEIKSTKDYLSKPHLRQIALYYLALNSNREFKNKINKVAFYYSLYGEYLEFKIEDIFGRMISEEITLPLIKKKSAKY